MSTIKQTCKKNKELMKRINDIKYYNLDSFIRDVNDYILSIRANAVCCIIRSIAKSQASMVLSLHSCERWCDRDRYEYRGYSCMLRSLGYVFTNDNGFIVKGNGNDMVFLTCHNIIKQLYQLNFLSDEVSESLAYKTPIIL